MLSDQFLRISFFSIWYTKELMDEDEEEEVVVKTTIRELVVYSVFLLMLSIGNSELIWNLVNFTDFILFFSYVQHDFSYLLPF